MKLKLLLMTVFAAGLMASIAIAKPPPGHGNPHGQATTTTAAGSTTAGTTTTTAASGKVLVCHKTGNGHYVLVYVSAHSALARGKRAGDVLAKDRTCPGPVQGSSGGGETTTGSTTTTTTGTTTTTTASTTTTTTGSTTTTTPGTTTTTP